MKNRAKWVFRGLSGSTTVPLVDGKNYSVESLAGERNLIGWSYDAGHIVPVRFRISAWEKAAPVRVLLDNSAGFDAAPFTRVLARNGDSIECQNLYVGTSLMSLYTLRDKDGYLLIRQPYSSSTQRAHWVMARSGLLGEIPRFKGDKTVIHHVNFDKCDNRPENLQFMSASAHAAFHRSLAERNQYWQSAEFEQRRVGALKAKSETSAGHEYFAARGTANILRYMSEQPDHFAEATRGNGKRGREFLIAYNQSAKGRAKSKEIGNRLYRCDFEGCEVVVRSGLGLHNHRRFRHGFNHKVRSVELLNSSVPLYSIETERFTSLAVEAGVFLTAARMFMSGRAI